MGQWQNFKIWRGRLPHWRADDVKYYVTFRHRRELDGQERNVLMRSLLKAEGRKLEMQIVCVLPEVTELIFTVMPDPSGEPYELADIVEKAKIKAGKLIIKKSGERFPPFYTESYDRILRDDCEFEEFWQRIFDSPVTLELVEDPEEYDDLWVSGAPNGLNA